MTNQNINQDHIYETSLLGWAVHELINGGTDWNTVAAFQFEGDAESYARYLNGEHRNKYVVAWVGTLHRA